MRVSDLLELEPVRRARPRWVVPATDREVTWVHSSEIYEIAPLLQGGEVLLTTGLGLVGADAEGLRRYVAGLADRGVAALALELGRTFPEPPGELVAACRAHDLTLLTFDAVVPFVQTCRAANEAVLDHEVTGLRHQQRITATLTSALLEGQSLPALVAHLAELTDTAVELIARDGHVVAQAPAGTSVDAAGIHEPVALFGRPWGELWAACDDASRPEVAAALERAVVAVELALLRTVDGVRQAGDARRALVLDLARGSYADAAELASRAAGVGLPTGRALLPFAVSADPGTSAAGLRLAVASVLERWAPGGIAGEVGEVVAVVAPSPPRTRPSLEEFADSVARLLARTGGGVRRVVADDPVDHPVELTAGLRAALEGVSAADRLGGDQQVLLPVDLAVLRTLRAAGDPALDLLVRTVLGPLLTHDARHRPALLPTLVAYVEAGRSKVTAAEQLGVRRQTVQARLRRITDLLDLDADRQSDATALELAITAWRVRGAGVA
ncbi:PucR family transcriptional regulator [Nitriliruptor alkaliphilus]|uniref:PucR family transcriptional regulator n=1 Tax=Nitriliruptor alkaliphilus TaxID=427918 RepID=UPI000697D191|nr:PucR family transcriptional regulator [Nitriliruptor alkaliphilus]